MLAFNLGYVDLKEEGANTMPMKNPPHTGRSVRTACLEPLGLSVTAGAEVLGVTRQTLNNVIHGKSGIQPRDGDPALEGVWQHARNVAMDAVRLYFEI